MQHESLVPMGPPKEDNEETTSATAPPSTTTTTSDEPSTSSSTQTRSDSNTQTSNRNRIPMLISNMGIKSVYPKEATRDVLNGRVAYWLMDENGATLLQPKHLLTALKLTKNNTERVGNFTCLGGHQRIIEQKTEKIPIHYRRKYISPELIGHGIYVSCYFF